ncbi:MAG: hypothetical protein GF398_12435 [Chitinivibrionales bacterium]|nr:hypothetical protein [Chitinivibrionales bacterium]
MKKCETCGVKTANIHLTHVMDGETRDLHLCEECAKKKGISISISAEGFAPEQFFDTAVPDVSCPRCRMHFSQFKAHGRLGCAACYQAFDREIRELLLEVHGDDTHRGKQYQPAKTLVNVMTEELPKLKVKLETAIRNEEFELAAALRDTINSMTVDEKKHK